MKHKRIHAPSYDTSERVAKLMWDYINAMRSVFPRNKRIPVTRGFLVALAADSWRALPSGNGITFHAFAYDWITKSEHKTAGLEFGPVVLYLIPDEKQLVKSDKMIIKANFGIEG